LWDVATGQPHGQPLTGHTDVVFKAAFSPDGKVLATGADLTVRLWDVATGLPPEHRYLATPTGCIGWRSVRTGSG